MQPEQPEQQDGFVYQIDASVADEPVVTASRVGGPLGTSGGVVLTEELIARYVAEAEAGYDVGQLTGRPYTDRTSDAARSPGQ